MLALPREEITQGVGVARDSKPGVRPAGQEPGAGAVEGGPGAVASWEPRKKVNGVGGSYGSLS